MLMIHDADITTAVNNANVDITNANDETDTTIQLMPTLTIMIYNNYGSSDNYC